MNVLLVEDNVDHAVVIERVLTRTMPEARVTLVQSIADAKQRLGDSNDFNVVLLDMALPDGQGPDNVTQLRKENSGIPIVVLTSLRDDDTAIAALEAGAQDYLTKDQLDSVSLKQKLRYAVTRFEVMRQTQTTVVKGDDVIPHYDHEPETLQVFAAPSQQSEEPQRSSPQTTSENEGNLDTVTNFTLPVRFSTDEEIVASDD